MESPESQAKQSEEEVRDLLEFLRVLARTLGFNDTALSRKADVPLTTLLRTFKGENDPRFSVFLAILHAMGLSVREFFELAYPDEEEPSEARLQIDRALGRVRGGKRSVKAPPKPERMISVDDIDRIFERLRTELMESADGVSKAEPSSRGSARPSEGGRR